MDNMVDSTTSSEDERTFSIASRSTTNITTPSPSINEIDPPLQLAITRDIGLSLEDYIALGSIVSPNLVSESVSKSTWTEVLDSDIFHKFLSGPLLLAIQRLHQANWIRVLLSAPSAAAVTTFRVYLLPDDVAQNTVERNSKPLRSLLPNLTSQCNLSPVVWNGQGSEFKDNFDTWATGIDTSLFWMFNKLPSPNPTSEDIHDRYSCASLNELLDDDPHVPGLKATLYRYQARSVALMIQKEASPRTHLDPRFEGRLGPDGRIFYYNARDNIFRREAPQYESVRGGILAETMGVGKTVMCIALMLATKHHVPRIPPHRLPGPRTRDRVGSLVQMATAAANRAGVPLKSHFRWVPRFRDMDTSKFTRIIDEEQAGYEIPCLPRRSVRRNQVLPPPRQLALCSATIVVVPQNLLHQWKSEFQKHVTDDEDGLRILIMENRRDRLPSSKHLMNFDVILFSKPRFEAESKDGVDDQGRDATNVRTGCQCPYIGASRIRDCSCFNPDDVYCSPLKELHFLRIVVDEGHEFSSTATNAVRVATQLVTAERRWVVSGTPAKERLFGVDVDLASNVEAEELAPLLMEQEINNSTTQSPMSLVEMQDKITAALDRRKRYSRLEETNGAAKSIGILAANFLGVRPWSGTENDQKIDWEDYAFRHESHKGRTYTAFSRCMDATLKALVVKTRPEDVSRDVTLPPLNHKVKYLEPSFYDTLTINIFILVITANAVTSERTDVDYLFHPKSIFERHRLVQNLRRSAFFWTGWSEEDIRGAIGHGERYLQKEGTLATEEDRVMLQGCLDFAHIVLKSKAWGAMSITHELGIFVNPWPGGTTQSWFLNGDENPSMIGGTQLRSAQRLINDQLFDENPTEGLEAIGAAEMAELVAAGERERAEKATKQKDGQETKLGVPTSGFQDGDKLNSNFSPRKKRGKKSGRKERKVDASPLTESTAGTATSESSTRSSETAPIKPAKRKRSDSIDQRDLPSDSPLATPAIVGTVSAKVSYLLGRIMALQAEEKILIFYDSDNTAWYIAQCLELMHVKHLIYSRHLRTDLRSRYVVTFDTDDSVRVLLMDLAHGAWGLNINKASRVFFVNPPFKPHIEAQAIKRAHRIGQTRPVFVETLILRGTVEEAIYERSRAMTREEHDQAGKEISDDKGVAEIIQKAKRLDIQAEDGVGWGQLAKLETPLQIFGSPGRGDLKIEGIDKVGDFNSGKEVKRRRKKEM